MSTNQYRAYDLLTGYRGPIRDTAEEAERDAQRHDDALGRVCRDAISDTRVVHDDGDGYAADEDGETVWPTHGQGGGAVRFRDERKTSR